VQATSIVASADSVSGDALASTILNQYPTFGSGAPYEVWEVSDRTSKGYKCIVIAAYADAVIGVLGGQSNSQAPYVTEQVVVFAVPSGRNSTGRSVAREALWPNDGLQDESVKASFDRKNCTLALIANNVRNQFEACLKMTMTRAPQRNLVRYYPGAEGFSIPRDGYISPADVIVHSFGRLAYVSKTDDAVLDTVAAYRGPERLPGEDPEACD
jgi:hypothetical protein